MLSIYVTGDRVTPVMPLMLNSDSADAAIAGLQFVVTEYDSDTQTGHKWFL